MTNDNSANDLLDCCNEIEAALQHYQEACGEVSKLEILQHLYEEAMSEK